MSVSVGVMRVDPELAKRFLECNTSNRPLRLERVRALARDMSEGRWRFNGAAIVIGNNGVLLDGQHRLSAIVESQMAFELTVAQGVDPSAYETIDAGARRNGADVLSVGGTKSAVALAATLRLLVWYNAGQPNFASFRLTNAEVAEANRNFPDARDVVQRLARDHGLRTLRANAPFYAVMREALIVNQPISDAFIQAVSDGAGLTKGDPRLTYREWMINRVNRRVTRSDMVFHVTVKAWNAFASGRQLSVLKMLDTESPPRLAL